MHERIAAAIAVALVAPPAVAYAISSHMAQHGLDIFSILLIEAMGFAAAVAILRPRPWDAARAGVLYFTAMSILIVWIGHRAGYYTM